MPISDLEGTGVALVTPFSNDGSLDLVSLRDHVDFCINGGVNYLVAMGSTGEAPTLRPSEKEKVLTTIIDQAQDRCPVITGHLSKNNTHSIVSELRSHRIKSLYGYMFSTPSYNKPSQSGLVSHFLQVDKHSHLPILMYNVPGRTGVNLSLESILKIKEKSQNIIGIKEASGNLDVFTKLVSGTKKDFLVISGDDALCLAQTAIGGNGVISVLANAFPHSISSMIDLALEGKIQKARALNLSIYSFHEFMYVEGNPVGLKALLKFMGKMESNVRLPLVSMSLDNRKRLAGHLDEIQSINPNILR